MQNSKVTITKHISIINLLNDKQVHSVWRIFATQVFKKMQNNELKFTLTLEFQLQSA